MRKPFALLHESRIYSMYPNTGFKSVLDLPSIQKQGNLYFVSEIEYRPNSFGIYQYDPVETFFHNESSMHKKQNRFDLAQAKKLIVDDRIPAYAEFWLNDPPEVNPITGEQEENCNSFRIQGGRNVLINFIGDNKHTEAIPELREIALHDDSKHLQKKALHTLQLFHTYEAEMVINEILGMKHDRYQIMDIVIALWGHSQFSTLYVSNLRKKFEEHYYDHTDNWLSVKWFNTVTQSIILACGHIPSLGALEIIEEGFKHPFAYVERTARIAIYRWLETVVHSGTKDPNLIKIALEKMKIYNNKVVYGDGWNTFKKHTKAAFIFD